MAAFPRTISRRKMLVVTGVVLFVVVIMFINAGIFSRLQLLFNGNEATATVVSVNADESTGSRGGKWYTYYVTVDGGDGQVLSVRSTINYLGYTPLPGSLVQPENVVIPVLVSADGNKVAVGSKQGIAAGSLAMIAVGLPILGLFVLAMRQYWQQATPEVLAPAVKKVKKHGRR